VHTVKDIPDDWIPQFQPKSYVDENIYNSLMDPPSWDEWLIAIHNLSNGKAAGPSGISNEMIKHLIADPHVIDRIYIIKCGATFIYKPCRSFFYIK